uniref:Uncharacterized protein n=1 Tax=Timema poppense TaxID=170557 RepID=A0A7R9HH41_TIMPO|nr:unnamed protein product [Timema poppensis]
MHLDYDFVKKQDETVYASVTGNKLDFSIGHLVIYLDNLFNGDKALGESLARPGIRYNAPRLLNGCEAWVCRQKHKSKLNAAVMRYLRIVSGETRKDRVSKEWLMNEFSLKGNTTGQCERSVLGYVDRMSVDRVMKQKYEGRVCGSKGRGDNMNTFLNENWEILAKDLGPFVAEAIAAVIKQIAAGLMDKVPYDDLLPENV